MVLTATSSPNYMLGTVLFVSSTVNRGVIIFSVQILYALQCLGGYSSDHPIVAEILV
jgi:hypothetical protein